MLHTNVNLMFLKGIKAFVITHVDDSRYTSKVIIGVPVTVHWSVHA